MLADGEEVGADALKWIIGLLRWCGWQVGVAGSVSGALQACCPVINQVCPEIWPVERGGGPLKHGGGASMASM